MTERAASIVVAAPASDSIPLVLLEYAAGLFASGSIAVIELGAKKHSAVEAQQQAFAEKVGVPLFYCAIASS